MLAKERQDKIYNMLKQNGAVTTSKLVEDFNVSIETIRRDLLCLEEEKKLTRVHGGAVTLGEMNPIYDLNKRNQRYSKEKTELSKTAVKFVDEGDFIGIDAGSTAISFAEALKEKFSELTVITHSSDVFEILRNHKNFSVILCGGHYMKGENVFYGALTLEMFEKLHMQKSFIFPSAVSLEYGICDYSQELYLIQRKIIENSDSIYILADSSKFEKRALLKVADMKPEFTYVTDNKLSSGLKKIYAENKICVYTEGENHGKQS